MERDEPAPARKPLPATTDPDALLTRPSGCGASSASCSACTGPASVIP